LVVNNISFCKLFSKEKRKKRKIKKRKKEKKKNKRGHEIKIIRPHAIRMA
jgi:hypothetical protein